jgi:hypothetical protein
MHSFEVPDTTPHDFVEAMRSALAEKEYDRFVVLDLEGDRLVVELRWMGTTRFQYRVRPERQGFRAKLVSEKVSPFHAVFADRFDEYFEKALAKVGARAV